MRSFFEWVTETDANWPDDPPGGAWGISIVDGTLTEVPPPEKKFHDTCRFFLEDPGPKLTKSVSENVARSLKAAPWKATLDRCKALSKQLRAQSPEDANAWFAGLLQQAKVEATAAAKQHDTRTPGVGVQRSWAATAPNARPGIVAPKASTPWRGGMQGPGVASPVAGRQMGPVAKRVKTNVVCAWFLKGQCWDGDRCPKVHSKG